MMWTLLPDLNVAPLKYAHVHREHGGPIHALAFKEHSLPEGKFFEAFAFLDGSKTGLKDLADQPHGTGLALTKPDAIHAAISEALEHWAWRTIRGNAALSASFRFDLDSSATGFAAFPGLGVQGAKKRAYFEAAQQWALCAWWEGLVGHTPLPNANGIQIVSPIPGVSIVVLWEAESEQTYYGVGTANTVSAATHRARLSLLRHKDLVRAGAAEHRLKYFASSAGAEAFCNRLEVKGKLGGAPTLAVDEVVMGPWHQYAHVWRCLFDCSQFREKDKDDYFLF